jgi:hypothetical protein
MLKLRLKTAIDYKVSSHHVDLWSHSYSRRPNRKCPEELCSRFMRMITLHGCIWRLLEKIYAFLNLQLSCSVIESLQLAVY